MSNLINKEDIKALLDSDNTPLLSPEDVDAVLYNLNLDEKENPKVASKSIKRRLSQQITGDKLVRLLAENKRLREAINVMSRCTCESDPTITCIVHPKGEKGDATIS